MEELRLAQQILEDALSIATTYELGEISALEIMKGEHNTVDQKKFLELFRSISKDTPMATSLIFINSVKAKYFCTDCAEYHVQDYGRLCPYCGSDRVSLLGGYGFYLESLIC